MNAPGSLSPSRSLTVRVALLLLVPIVLLLTLHGWIRLEMRRADLHAGAVRSLDNLGHVVALSLNAFLDGRSLDQLGELTDGLSGAEQLRGVLVYDHHARLVHRSRSVASLAPLVEPLAREALGAPRPLTRVIATRDDGDQLTYAMALRHGPGGPLRGVVVLVRDLRSLDDRLAQFTREITALGLALGLILTALTLVGLRSAVIRPIGVLARHAERVAEGSLDEVVEVGRRDEVGRLAMAFDHMLRSLRATRADLDAEHEAATSLERRLQHAQRLALIGQLSATLAHQVGSPLNVVLGRARYALQQGVHEPRVERHLREIESGAVQISQVIESLLSHARRVRGRTEPVDLGELAKATARFLEAECEAQGVRMSVDAKEGVVVEGSRPELEQVMLNLMINAIQAQPSGGAVEVKVRAMASDDHGGAEFSVDDAGPGVPEEARAKVFEAFFTTKAAEGTGLGLSISDEMVRRHGGTIRVEDSPLGGARFVVRLPQTGHGGVA
ncbi:MAG: HAMP domain-containing histidine kinase [Deltaproteobacteria bacterium]|nr:HAMP domain-containing histidine kinase [Deltaproteobacteria bacterium]